VAELTGFHYRSGSSVLHRLDVRMKLVLLALFSAAGLHVNSAGLLLLGLPLLALAWTSRVAPSLRSRELRWLWLLLGVVFAARAISTDGAALFSLGAVVVTREGARDGLQVCLRLILVSLMGSMFAASTRPGHVKAGVQWLLEPLPFIPAERVATMLGLIVRFIPLIFEEVSRTMEAQRARAVENRRNPVYRMVMFGIPLLRRVFETSDRLALAMEARGYTESRTGLELRAGRRDWAALAAGSGWLALLLVVQKGV
jgi:energy-coupling factor transporter transmembrane protein EcfT